MNDFFCMDVLKWHDDTGNDKFLIMELNTCLVFGKIFFIADMIA